MKASRRLKPAIEVAQQHADDAARKLAECQLRVKNQKTQLQELVGYRDDYTSGLRHKSRSGLNAAQMNDFSLFMNRLNSAIEQLQQSLQVTSRELSVCKQDLLEKLQRAKALEGVVKRYQESERQAQSRREQYESDEHGQRLVRTVFN